MSARGGAGAAETRLGRVDRFLVPLDDGRVLGWFLDHLYVVHGKRDRLRRRLLRMGVPPALLLPPSRPDEWNGAPGLLAELVREGPAHLFGEDPVRLERPLRAVLLRDYEAGDRGRYVIFYFESGSRTPAAVLKVRKAGEEGRSLSAEMEALRHVRSLLSGPMLETVPEPLACASGRRMEALLLSSLPGTSFYVEAFSARSPRALAGSHLQTAARWLARFHEETAAGSDGGPLPLSAAHGDFWSRNALRRPGEALPAVVDWEHAEMASPPMEDLFHFPLSYALHFPWSGGARAGSEEAFRLGFLAENRVSKAVGGYFRTYCEARGLPPAECLDLFLSYLDRRDSCGEDDEPWQTFQESLTAASRSVFSG